MDFDKKLHKILKKVFKKSKINKKIKDIKLEKIMEWDSLKHFHLLLEVEKEFDLRFSSDEFTKIKSIKDILFEIKKNENSKRN